MDKSVIKGKSTCTGNPMIRYLMRECRNEIEKREKAVDKRSQAWNRLYFLTYLTLIFVLASTIISLFVYVHVKQITNSKIATSCDVLNFNVSDGKSAEYFPDANAASNLTKGHVIQKGHLLTYTYKIENEGYIVKYIFVISIMFLIFSLAMIPIVIFNHAVDNPVYNDSILRDWEFDPDIAADFLTEEITINMAITKKKNTCKEEAQDSGTINYRFLRECRKEIRKRDRARYMRNQARNRLFSMVYANLFLVLATTIVCLYVYFKCKQIAMENAPPFNVPNFNIPDTKSGKHLPDAKAASNLTHGNVASTVVSHFIHLPYKQIMNGNATSFNDQNINISDVKSAKHLSNAKAASNLTHGNVNLLTFS
ncbi:hypothetical protein CDAR_251911 [Caerostris darwini]|uniref:Uncharacterized protein n=1 Tax=Caerostris darwini TaxID=1538125 RepID=A0AAV4QDL5_9ARAC|nr:hypothetical protein CDAR_251911 [Caerostris darwini]